MDKRNKNKINIVKCLKIIFLLFVVITSFVYTIKFLDKVNLKVDDLFLLTLVDGSNNVESNGISSSVVDYVIKLDIFNPVALLQSNYKGLVEKVDNNVNNQEEVIPVIKPEEEIIDKNKPVVYIYNTHQSEEYKSNNLSIHNIRPSIMTASYMLEEKLENYGISAMVEESNVSEILRINNWNYASSYIVTKMLMKDAKEKYPSIKYFIDLHRDSVSYNKTTATINNKKYAKVLFLLGLENKNYKESRIVISKMNDIISTKYKGISRGIYEKGGKGVNGVYNQDFSSRCVLIEVGGVDNTIIEVSNTIDAIGDMLNTYIKEDYEQFS